MNNIAYIAELHKLLGHLAPAACTQQKIMDHGFGCGASNQPSNALDFQTRISLTDLYGTDKWAGFLQGFHCVEINLRAAWGGCHYDGNPLKDIKVTAHILNRLAGGMAIETWGTAPATYTKNIVEFDEIVAPVIKLITK